MAYLQTAVSTGVEKAAPLLAKARAASTTVDSAAVKLGALVLAPLKTKGAPLLEAADAALDARVAQAKGAVAEAQSRVEGVKSFAKAEAQSRVDGAKAFAAAKKAQTVAKAQGAVAQAKAKALSTKAFAEEQLFAGVKRFGNPKVEEAVKFALASPSEAAAAAKAKALVFLLAAKVQLGAVPTTLQAKYALLRRETSIAKEYALGKKALLQAKYESFDAKAQLALAKEFALGKKALLQAKLATFDANAHYALAKDFLVAKKNDVELVLVRLQARVESVLTTVQPTEYLKRAQLYAAPLLDAKQRRVLVEQCAARGVAAYGTAKASAMRVMKAKGA